MLLKLEVKLKITWLGHSGFKIELANQIFLIDPWLYGNPVFPEEKIGVTLNGVTHCLLSHAHSDHAKDAIKIAENRDITIVGIYDFMTHLERTYKLKCLGFNRGGTINIGDIKITMVAASHSSSFETDGKTYYGGSEAGFMISGQNRSIYFSGDTDIMADMAWFNELHSPEIGILSAGGHFTMDMERAAFAAHKFFNFKTVIPCHYKTFSVLEQSASELTKRLPNVAVIEPEVLRTIEL